MNATEQERYQAKTPEQRFKHMLRTEFSFSGKLAELILAEAQAYLIGPPGVLRPGQMRVILADQRARHGQALGATATKEVIWTVDGGEADREVLSRHGAVVLRRQRVQRLLEEAVEQGAVATQEDLAQVLQVSVRTIKRDFASLHAAGEWLPSRGYLKGIGRGQTHKARIIRRWLQGATYDQLVRDTRHALSSIRRYVATFVRVLQFHQQGFEPPQIAHLVQIGLPLVQEYLALWAENETPATRERLADQLQRFSKRKPVPKRGQP